MKFDLEKFVNDCKSATKKDNARELILELVKKAIENPDSLILAIGDQNNSTYDKIYVYDYVIIVNVFWSPGLSIVPHNHNCWAVIGVYVGQEKNIFWQIIKGMIMAKYKKLVIKSLTLESLLNLEVI